MLERLVRFINEGNDTGVTFGEERQINDYQFLLPVIVDGKEMDENDINFIIEPHTVGGKILYQPHIHIREDLRGQGLGTRIYKAFIYEFGNLYSHYWCRTNSLEIPKMYRRLSKNPDFRFIKTNKYYYIELKNQE